MKVIILKTNLKDGLSSVERAIATENTLPILKYVLLQTDTSRITLSGTNLEIGITATIPGKVVSTGRATVPFQAFATIITNSDSERITLELNEQALFIHTDNYHAKLQTLKPEEFPLIPNIEHADQTIEINGDILKQAFADIVYAAQLSEIRPELSGVLVDFNVDSLKLVATDSFRLAERTLGASQFTTGIRKPFRAIIPLRTAHEIGRIFPSDARVTLTFDPHQVLVASHEIRLVSRLIDGTYPDYEQIIPKATMCELVVDRAAFLQSVKLVSTFSGKVNDIKLKIRDSGKTLEVYSASQHLGENQYLIPVACTGDAFSEVSFNWRFLLDGLKAFPGERVSFSVNGDSKPAVIRSNKEHAYFYLLMPIKQ